MPQHIMYFDESGDHGLDKVDQDFPVFVLCGCLYQVSDYLSHELQSFSATKFKNYGHDAVVYHSREIRKQVGPFQILQNAATRDIFLSDIATFFKNSKVTIIAAVIDKRWLKKQYKYPDDPYDMALLFCLERLRGCMADRGCPQDPVTCIFEERGKNDDNRLAGTFQRIVSGANMWGALPYKMVFASKLANMPGLQVADLAAYPIARKIIAPTGKTYLTMLWRRSSGARHKERSRDGD